ncbi:Eco57I restriction-modification methylase domain-containing protein [Micromonospora haikouensis]|uniref:Eco57I restriction-modification methylase domain-containing protein n=1 Tax=Micromonospora haikouensis TaxID=686309 RepID=UPI0033D3A19D
MLDALLVLRHRGKAAEQLSYSSLGVEQLGHVYEGLLEFSCARVREPHVGLIGKREPELPLAELEAAAAQGEAELRVWLVARCDLTVRQVERARAATPAPHQLAALHAACDNDADLTDRVRPYWGLLRVDLRDLPTVFPAGSVLFTQFGDRRNTGTHYTPRELAEEVVRHTLAPLCFSPGPAQGVTDEGVWRAKTADELLRLKVLDPAMGSGAFLVAACRYLAEVVVRAWQRDGLPAELSDLANGNPDQEDLLLAARRLVAARCLYGVDRDDMAVELAKLSLWLVTLAKGKPFGFLDHALRCGDSLVGLTSLDQLTAFHLDPEVGRFQHSRLFGDLVDRLHRTVDEMTALRDSIGATVVEDTRDAADKDAKLAEVEHLGRGLRLAADAVVGAALSTAVRPQRRPWDPEDDTDDPETKYDGRLLGISDNVHRLLDGPYDVELEQRIGITVSGWLRGTRPEPIRPLHWPLEFPEVVNRAGFDAVIGNPPFVGGQRLTGAIGPDVREYLVERIGRGKRGSADLCSYFLLRNLSVTGKGRVGIIATNTIAQGDTREVGLDQIVLDQRWVIYRANKSQPWPGTASLEVSLLWVGHIDSKEERFLDGRPVKAITPSLDAESRVTGKPYRLRQQANEAFIGSYLLGDGFILEKDQARELIRKNHANSEVIFPFLNGEDLNTQPDCSARRWVINFRDWPIEKAQGYPDCFSIVERKVKPFRAGNKIYGRRERWWQYAGTTPALYNAIEGLDNVIVIAQTSRTQIPAIVSARQTLSQSLVVFATSSTGKLALISSEFQYLWTAKNSASMKNDLRFIPSDCYETFPQPYMTERMERVGAELDSYRRSVMLGRELGLTKLYNLVHDEQVTSADIKRLRDIHVEIDEAVAEAYNFDLTLGHAFHQTRQGTRFTIAPTVQVDVLDLLLELNHQRHAQEKPQQPTTRRQPRKQTTAVSRSRSAEDSAAMPPALDDGLFPLPDALF